MPIHKPPVIKRHIRLPAIESKNLGSDTRSQLQQKMQEIRIKLLDEQRNLQSLATGDVGLSKATVMSFKFR